VVEIEVASELDRAAGDCRRADPFHSGWRLIENDGGGGNLSFSGKLLANLAQSARGIPKNATCHCQSNERGGYDCDPPETPCYGKNHRRSGTIHRRRQSSRPESSSVPVIVKVR